MSESSEIWEMLKSDKVDALEVLYRRYFNDLFNYGKRLCSDIALVEDAVQETFLNIWKYRQTSSVPATEKAYILRAFRNQLIQLLRTRSVFVADEERVQFNFEISIDHKIVESEDADKISSGINKALKELTSRQREIIYYRFFEGLSFDEIAGIMNMQTRATYKLTARALSTLKELLGPKVFSLVFVFLNVQVSLK